MSIFGSIGNAFKKAGNEIDKTFTKTIPQNIAKPFGNNGTIFKDINRNVFMPVANGITKDIPNVLQDVGKGVGSIASVVGGTAKDILGGVSGLAKGIGSIGENFQLLLIGGILIAVITLVKR